MLHPPARLLLARACVVACLAACALQAPAGADTYGQPVAAPPSLGGEAATGEALGSGAAAGSAAAGGASEGVCPPQAYNARGVGKRCTRGGGQCNNVDAQYCTADYTRLPLWFCTLPCDGSTDCGAGARCAPDPQAPHFFTCLPESCIVVDPPATLPALSSCLPQAPGPRGIGAPCTANGGECRNLTAGLCLVDALPASPFAMCSLVCRTDADCDAQSACFAAPGGLNLNVCLPRACLP